MSSAVSRNNIIKEVSDTVRLVSVIFLMNVALMLASCKKGEECPTCPPPSESFLLRIIVKDTSGHSVSGLRVSAYNNLSIRLYQSNSPAVHRVNTSRLSPIMISTTTDTFALRPNYPNPFDPSTTIPFVLLVPSIVTMKVSNLLGQDVAILVNSEALNNGNRIVQFYGDTLLPGVYKVRLFARSIRDSLSSILPLRDSIFVYLYKGPDAEQTIIGYTSPEGICETSNDLLFPSLFSLPPLIHTNLDFDSIGTFTNRDTVTIVLTDTISNRLQTFQRSIRRGTNEFQLTWMPAQGQHSANLNKNEMEN